jgi:hypothetical protein
MEETQIPDGQDEKTTLAILEAKFLVNYSRYNDNLSRIKTLLSFKSKRKRKELKRLQDLNRSLALRCHDLSKMIEEHKALVEGEKDE